MCYPLIINYLFINFQPPSKSASAKKAEPPTPTTESPTLDDFKKIDKKDIKLGRV